jgi:hypothetical protein
MLKFERKLITPAIAKELLKNNKFNRRIRRLLVINYTNEMLNNKWKVDTGEMIKISKTGVILDGQHRLLAIVKSNKSIYFHIAFDIDDEVFDVIDTGKGRSSNDTFQVKGIQRDNVLPSTISIYNLLIANRRLGVQIHHKSTNAALLEQYLLDETFWQHVTKQSHNYYLAFAKILPPSYIGGFYAFFLKLNENKAEEFMKQLATGIGISNECILLLRNKLMQDKMSIRKMLPTLKMALIIKTWNLFVKNQTVKILKFEQNREEFPIALK